MSYQGKLIKLEAKSNYNSCFRGGHEDHDACYYLNKKLSFKDVLKIYHLLLIMEKIYPSFFIRYKALERKWFN